MGRTRPTARSLPRAVASFVLALMALSVLQVAAAGPAAAHAELVESTPANGERLTEAPAEVTLRFTESVGLVDGGLVLLDAQGRPLDTEEPTVEGTTVRWQLPADLLDGSYLVSWRVVSGDSHPVSGAFSFGVGVAPEPAVATQPSTAPWPVTAARFGGYLGFSVVIGAVAFVSLCWPSGRGRPGTRRLIAAGLLVGGASTLLILLLHGPYVAGQPMGRLLDRELLSATSHSSFGAWTQVRLYLYVFLAAILLSSAALESPVTRQLAGMGLVTAAVTFSGTGHAAASGLVLDRAVDTVHVLAAGTWLGGLVMLALAATRPRDARPPAEAISRFSRLALASVLVLVATGIASSVLRLDDVAQLWRSDYGRLLTAKIALVAVALGAAWLSRARVRHAQEPWTTVRAEAVITVVVLAVTAVLASTTPPATGTASGTAATAQALAGTTVEMDLGEGRRAMLHLDGLSTAGSELHLELLDGAGQPLEVDTVRLQGSLDSRELGPLEMPLDPEPTGWYGSFDFPFPGSWTLTLTVESAALGGLVTAGEVTIGEG